MATLQNNRFRGALIGVLAGDALGAPYETWKAADVVVDLEKRGGLVGFEYVNPWVKTEGSKTFPAGRPTDDSDHTAALAQSLIAHNGLNERDLFYRLRDIVVNHKSPLWDSKAYGAGGTTRKMLAPETYEGSCALSSEGAISSNGSLMRAAPLALYFVARHKGKVDPKIVHRMSAVTHRHRFAKKCCVAYVDVLVNLLLGLGIKDSIGGARWDLNRDNDEGLTELLDDPCVPPNVTDAYRGSALVTLHAALWALATSSNFREGITKVIALGGDTDTYAAVAGGLLGAYYGEQGIPPEWREILIGRQVMENLADEFSIMANESCCM